MGFIYQLRTFKGNLALQAITTLLHCVSTPLKNHFISHFHFVKFLLFYLAEENMSMPINLSSFINRVGG